MKRALITGVTGQDGSYLAEQLLAKGYEVHGTKRRASSFNTERIDGLYVDTHGQPTKFYLHYADLADAGSLYHLIHDIQPDEIYNLAGQSHVRVSFDIPEYTADITAIGPLRILEAMRRTGSKARFYQASSSEMFGAAQPPQDETTVFAPRSPYAAAKLFAHHMTVNYRESYGMFACSGILFNHESPRRGPTFVTRKIARTVALIHAGLEEALYLGNLDAKRDWGYAPEYTEAMWLMLQHDRPADYVIGTGYTHTVRDFVEAAFAYVNLDWHDYVKVDPRYYRPTEVEALKADASKAAQELGWRHRTEFPELVALMLDAEIAALAEQNRSVGRS